MSKLTAIVGDTGSGKSTSIQHLDSKTTFIINVAGKELPFKGSNKLYNVENKNYKEIDEPKEILALLRNISEKAPQIKNVIIEDANYTMAFALVRKATEVGYTKFSIMAQDTVNLVQGAKKLREDLNIFYFCHLDEVEDSGEITSYKMKTAGKMIDNQVKLEGLFTVVLYAVPESKGEKTEYNFITNRYKKYPAKSPMGMFSDLKIPNNLKLVSDTINEYYS